MSVWTLTWPPMSWPLMGDREWTAACLRERLQHPELYEGRENAGAVVERLRATLAACEQQEEERGHG